MRELQDRLFDEMVGNPALKERMIAFIDVAASAPSHQLPHYLDLYFPHGEFRAEGLIGSALRAGTYRMNGRRFVNDPLVAWGIRFGLRQMGNRFLMGERPEQALKKVRRLDRGGIYATLNIVTEHIVSAREADRYRDRILKLMDLWVDQHHGPEVTAGGVPVRHHSLKLSALTQRLHPLAEEELLYAPHEARDRLRQIFQKAREYKAAGHPVMVELDPEERSVRDLSYKIFWAALTEPDLAGWDEAGLGIQAYFKDSAAVLQRTIELARQTGKRPQVRIIKGAYHRYEQIVASLMGWEVPVYDFQDETDRSFARMVELAFQNHRYIRVAVGTHNYRDLDIVHSLREKYGLPSEVVENQFLYGVGDPMLEAVVGEGLIARAYGPVGGCVEGTPYQVRRLPEVRPDSAIGMTHLKGMSYDLYVEQMRKREERPPIVAVSEPEFDNEPASNFADETVLKKMQAAIDAATARRPVDVVPLIGDEEIPFDTARARRATNPADYDHVIGRIIEANEAETDRAIEAAQRGFEEWSATPQERRSAILRRAAEITRERMYEIAADIVVEAGKPWANALADVQEGIDFLVAYALWAEKMGKRPLGVGVAISPFNFPFAIAMGEVAGPLSKGNAVILKPAEQAPISGRHVVKILREAGVPNGAVQFLPGVGNVVGQRLVESPKIDFIAFTGSKGIADRILETAAAHASARNGIKIVVAETGGKNPVIIDESADPDIAVEAVLDSAFGMAGERCSAGSRVLLVGSVADRVLDRLVEGARSMVFGDPRDRATQIGPLIDGTAVLKATGAIKRNAADGQGRLLFRGDQVTDKIGYYLPPHIFDNVSPNDEIGQRELFAPVLSVLRVSSFEEAMEVANGTPYGLTAALISRNPENIRRFLAEIRAGNAYVNRGPVGAMVAMQPFGGADASGTGPQAGGPHYIERFTLPVGRRDLQETTHLSTRLFGPKEYDRMMNDPKEIEGLRRRQRDWARSSLQERLALLNKLNLPFAFDDLREHYDRQAKRLLTPRTTLEKPGEINKSAHDRPLGIGLIAGGSEFDTVAATIAAVLMGNAVLLPDSALGREIIARFEAAVLPRNLLQIGGTGSAGSTDLLREPWLDFLVTHGPDGADLYSQFIPPVDSRPAFRRFIGVTDSPLDWNYLTRFAIPRTKTVRTLRFGDQLSPGQVL